MTAAAIVAGLRRLAEEAVARHALCLLVARDPAAGHALAADEDLRLLVEAAVNLGADAGMARAALEMAMRHADGRP